MRDIAENRYPYSPTPQCPYGPPDQYLQTARAHSQSPSKLKCLFQAFRFLQNLSPPGDARSDDPPDQADLQVPEAPLEEIHHRRGSFRILFFVWDRYYCRLALYFRPVLGAFEVHKAVGKSLTHSTYIHHFLPGLYNSCRSVRAEGVTASPPRAVQRSSLGSILPTEYTASIVSSRSMGLV